MKPTPTLGAALGAFALVLTGCSSGTPTPSADAPTTAAAPAASSTPTPTPTQTPTPQPTVALGSVVTGFTSTGAAAFEPTITTSGFQERGIVLGSMNPDTLSQWYRQDGTPANVLTGMNRVR